MKIGSHLVTKGVYVLAGAIKLRGTWDAKTQTEEDVCADTAAFCVSHLVSNWFYHWTLWACCFVNHLCSALVCKQCRCANVEFWPSLFLMRYSMNIQPVHFHYTNIKRCCTELKRLWFVVVIVLILLMVCWPATFEYWSTINLRRLCPPLFVSVS